MIPRSIGPTRPSCATSPTSPTTTPSTPAGPPSGRFQSCLQRATGGSAPAAATAHEQALDLLAAQQASNLQYLALQQELANPRHSVISNVLKVRHDTTKNAIANIR